MRLLYVPQVLRDIMPYEPCFLAIHSLALPPLMDVHVFQCYNFQNTIHVQTKQNADNLWALVRSSK